MATYCLITARTIAYIVLRAYCDAMGSAADRQHVVAVPVAAGVGGVLRCQGSVEVSGGKAAGVGKGVGRSVGKRTLGALEPPISPNLLMVCDLQ